MVSGYSVFSFGLEQSGYSLEKYRRDLKTLLLHLVCQLARGVETGGGEHGKTFFF